MTQTDDKPKAGGIKLRQTRFNRQVNVSFKHNLTVLVVFESIWWMGFGIVIPSVFLPSYLNTLGSPKTLIGIVTSLYFITMPLNFVCDYLPARIPRKYLVMFGHGTLGIIYVLTGVLSLFFESPAALITIISVAMVCFFSIVNISTPLYTEIYTDNIPKSRRGRAFSLRVACAGVCGLVSTLLAAGFLRHSESALHSNHYALIIAGVIYIIAVSLITRVKDNVDPSKGPRRKTSYKISFFHNNYILMKNLWFRPNYRVLAFFSILLIASGLLGAFMVTSAQDVLGMNMENLQDNLRPIYLIVLIAGALVTGPIADRWGFLAMLCALGICIAAGNFLMLFPNKIIFFIAYNLNVCGMSFIGMAMTNLCLEMLPKVRTSRLIAATNLFCLPVNFLIPWMFGAIIDARKAENITEAGYYMTFMAGFILAAVAVAGFVFIVEEPRGGKELTYRFFKRT